ncbi:putative membrane protein YdjX (TVP38/TMEM64 family) [Natranaerovirga hydrolytica]|uniref:TVP38/TMEM64 family membrane protein n=1 Tax=Natranaerovirga hydrolytica TaxID=680378 RepID=A0A4R1MZK1_9FIRM|nr:VTT domain-containing protein [Natranaerovirga hydrolytica]TCK98615.1 putative membrane protein YdjX (TVP38/TMEM64 family) [Natranaerovirga hydrolytica]
MSDIFQKRMKLIGIALFVLIIVYIYNHYFNFMSKDYFFQQIDYYKELDLFFIGYIIAGIILCCLFVPMSWIKAGAALTMGIGRGLVASLIIANVFAIISFAIGRLLSEKFLYSWFEKYKEKHSLNYEYYMEKIQKNGFYYVLYMRNVPIITAAMLNYLCSMTTIDFKKYFLGSFIGMIPGTVLNVYLFSSVTHWTPNIFNVIILSIVILLYYIVLHKYTKKHITE